MSEPAGPLVLKLVLHRFRVSLVAVQPSMNVEQEGLRNPCFYPVEGSALLSKDSSYLKNKRDALELYTHAVTHTHTHTFKHTHSHAVCCEGHDVPRLPTTELSPSPLSL